MEWKSVLSEPFLTLDVFDKIVVISFYLTIVLMAMGIIAAFVIKIIDRTKLTAFAQKAKYFTFGYALSISVLMITLKVSESIAVGEFSANLFWPIMSVFIVMLLTLSIGWIISLKNKAFLHKYKFIALVINLIPVIVSIVMLAKYYKTVAEYYSGVSQSGLYVSAVLLVLFLILGVTFLSKSKNKQWSTREMAYAAISLALAFALSYIKFLELPQGGSVTLASMLPLILFSYMFGMKKGIVVGIAYGVLQAIQDPFIIHPAQFFLDYPIAFGMVGFAGIFHELGFFKNKPIISFSLGAIIAVFLRYICHVLSGIFAFSVYAAPGYSAVAWGFLYNCFVFVDLAIVLVVGMLLMGSRSFVRLIETKSSNDDENNTEDEKSFENA